MKEVVFSSQKFKKQTLQKQHKILSEVLYLLYTHIHHLELKKKYTFQYHQYCFWAAISPMNVETIETITDAYHTHLKLAAWQLQEHDFLPSFYPQDGTLSQSPKHPIHIVLDNLRSSHNIGNILRSVDVVNFEKVYLYSRQVLVNWNRVQKTSKEAACHIDTEIISTLDHPFYTPIFALETIKEGINIHEFIFPSSFTLVVGNEEYGISKEWLKKTDAVIYIPTYGYKNSLNVASAFSYATAIFKQQDHQKGIRHVPI